MTVPLTEGRIQVAQLFAEILEPFDESRRRTGDLFDGNTWTPGCLVCAMGAVMEELIPEDVLRTTTSNAEGLYDALHEAVQSRIGPVQRQEMSDVYAIVIHANDTWNYTFEQNAAYLRRRAANEAAK